MGETKLHPLFEYLLDLDKPVDECARAFCCIYEQAVGTIRIAIENKREQLESDEQIEQAFINKTSKLIKLHELTMFQFVDTHGLVNHLVEIYNSIKDLPFDGCMKELDRRRGRPVEVYYEPQEGEEPTEDDKEGYLDFVNYRSDISRFYTPEFKEYLGTIDKKIEDEIMSKVTPDTTARERIRITKEAITHATIDNPIYAIHRILAGIQVPAGHIDVEPDTEKGKDGKWHLKPNHKRDYMYEHA